MELQQTLKRHYKKTGITHLRIYIKDALTDYMIYMQNNAVTFILQRNWDKNRVEVWDCRIYKLPLNVESILNEHIKTKIKYQDESIRPFED